ncbi:hypothetical protein KUTeg_001419 [Tegillarca granosa]|uniref:Integrase catalytic domain-containing protein n=1 Tax=Tegillarca granosa TaxID=220873 RepID=A0ABQ9FT13_TEGGR|nr:hypothetical protein KUTeg_001419 [Tegillarca granosa]
MTVCYSYRREKSKFIKNKPQMNPNEQAATISTYLSFGIPYEEILGLLAQKHDVFISMKTLKRRLASYGLYRRKNFTDIIIVAMFIQEQVQLSGCLHGYRWMYNKCLQNGMVVQRDMVRILLKILDPPGVTLRIRGKLRRRQYTSKGPNYIWHIDSYDKLKPYGICINACIDGYSRFIIWLRVGRSTSNPRVIARHYVEALASLERMPYSLRTDMGTENGHIAEMQSFLRRNGPGSRKAFIYGTSQHNQRIDSCWGIFRKECAQFWITFFGKIKNDGHFTGDFIDKNLMRYFFLDIIRNEMNDVVKTWNSHRIRKSERSAEYGRPIVLYHAPLLNDTQDYSLPLNKIELLACADECDFTEGYCDEDIKDLADIIMRENNWRKSTDPYEAATIYLQMRNIIRQNKKYLSYCRKFLVNLTFVLLI